jgi:hypothetical protein
LRREKNKKERVRDDLTPFLEEPACPTKNRYRVVVGGLGIVFEDYSKLEAKRQFNQTLLLVNEIFEKPPSRDEKVSGSLTESSTTGTTSLF